MKKNKAKLRATLKKHVSTCHQCGALIRCGSKKDWAALYSFRSAVIHGSDWSEAWLPTKNRIMRYYANYGSPAELDAQSIGLDWAMVGYDLEKALKEIEQREPIAAE